MLTSLTVSMPRLAPLIGEGGQRFLELTSIGFLQRPVRRWALMHEEPLPRGEGVARVLYDLSADCRTNLDPATVRTRL